MERGQRMIVAHGMAMSGRYDHSQSHSQSHSQKDATREVKSGDLTPGRGGGGGSSSGGKGTWSWTPGLGATFVPYDGATKDGATIAPPKSEKGGTFPAVLLDDGPNTHHNGEHRNGDGDALPAATGTGDGNSDPTRSRHLVRQTPSPGEHAKLFVQVHSWVDRRC